MKIVPFEQNWSVRQSLFLLWLDRYEVAPDDPINGSQLLNSISKTLELH